MEKEILLEFIDYNYAEFISTFIPSDRYGNYSEFRIKEMVFFFVVNNIITVKLIRNYIGRDRYLMELTQKGMNILKTKNENNSYIIELCIVLHYNTPGFYSQYFKNGITH